MSVQIVKQTKEEKYEMYFKLKKKDLILMMILFIFMELYITIQ